MCAMDNFIWIYLHIHGECAIIKSTYKSTKSTQTRNARSAENHGRNQAKLRNGGRGKS